MLENREGGCHCGRVRFRARVDLDLLSQCSCTVCTKKGILHLPVAPENFELLRGKNSLSTYTFGTGVAQHTFCSHCGMHAFYVPRSQPDRITVNARCLDDVDGPSLKPTRFFDGRHWEEAQRRRIAEGGHIAAAGLNGGGDTKENSGPLSDTRHRSPRPDSGQDPRAHRSRKRLCHRVNSLARVRRKEGIALQLAENP